MRWQSDSNSTLINRVVGASLRADFEANTCQNMTDDGCLMMKFDRVVCGQKLT